MIAVFVLFVALEGTSQTPAFHPDSVNRAVLVNASGSVSLPGADLAERFGISGLVGVGLGLKNRHNWVFGANARLLFGGDVREDTILRNITTDSGFVIGLDGLLYEPLLYERGFIVSAGLSKVIPVVKRLPNSGILLGLHATFLQHKILYSVRPEEMVPQLNREMRKGYDRLSNGLAVNEAVGWFHMSRNGLVNFQVAFECIQAFTRNRRTLNFDTMTTDTARRIDLLYSLTVTWTLPLWLRDKDSVIYYN